MKLLLEGLRLGMEALYAILKQNFSAARLALVREILHPERKFRARLQNLPEGDGTEKTETEGKNGESGGFGPAGLEGDFEEWLRRVLLGGSIAAA